MIQRIMKNGFTDGRAGRYNPTILRLGMGRRVNDKYCVSLRCHLLASSSSPPSSMAWGASSPCLSQCLLATVVFFFSRILGLDIHRLVFVSTCPHKSLPSFLRVGAVESRQCPWRTRWKRNRYSSEKTPTGALRLTSLGAAPLTLILLSL